MNNKITNDKSKKKVIMNLYFILVGLHLSKIVLSNSFLISSNQITRARESNTD